MQKRTLVGRIPAAVILSVGLILSPLVAAAQSGSQTTPPAGLPAGPPPPKNLQFFPKDTLRPELVAKMRQFSFALGVRCEHCHVDERDGSNPPQDFASDEKRAKVKARAMLRMTKAINDQLLPTIPSREVPAVEVTCATCHHGLSRPETLPARLSRVAAKGGADAAVAELQRLRDRAEFGLFDVSEWGVNEAASSLSAEGKNSEALAVLQANAGYHPESDAIPTLIVQVHVAMGNTGAAVVILKKLLATDPENRRIKRMLDRLTKDDEPKR